MNVRKFFISAFLLPIVVNAQTSIFNDGESTTGALRNMAHNASTGVEAAIYNPAGLSFASGQFAVSVNGIANYQQVLCSNYPWDNTDGAFNRKQNAQLFGISPSVQAFAKIKKTTISLSYANEGGTRWSDPDGDVVLNHYLETNPEIQSSLALTNLLLAASGYLANEDDYLFFSTKDFVSQSYNRCVRLGASYDFGNGLSAYLGLRYNHINVNTKSDLGMYMFIPSRNEKMLFADYNEKVANQSLDIDNSINEIDSLLQNSFNYPSINTRSISPVISLAYNYKTLNMGVKYEMSPSVFLNTDGLYYPHSFSLGVSNLFWNRMLLSLGADVKCGYKGNGAILFNAEKQPVVYQIAMGIEFSVVPDRFNISASVAGGNTVISNTVVNVTKDYITSTMNNWKASFGVQCKIVNNLVADCGVMMNLRTINDLENVINGGTPIDSFLYQFGYRYAAGVGLTYVFSE